MSFELEQRERDGVTILAPRGRLTAGEPVEAMRARLEPMFSVSEARVVIDLTGTDYIDSSALGCLVYAHQQVEAHNGRMALYGISARNLELMVITKLSTVFRIFEEEGDAVNACWPGREPRKFDILDFVRQQRTEREERSG
jgi:anti-sigma B factor antagonist